MGDLIQSPSVLASALGGGGVSDLTNPFSGSPRANEHRAQHRSSHAGGGGGGVDVLLTSSLGCQLMMPHSSSGDYSSPCQVLL